LRLNICEAWTGTVAASCTGPSTATPAISTRSPARVPATLPPVSAARSTTTEPGRIEASPAASTSTGARRPGTWAVAMTKSWVGSAAASAARVFACSSSLWALAYPPAASASAEASGPTKVAPRLSTCSRAAARTSKPATTAPSRRAVAMAWRPATPAPRISARAGARVPAAVESMGRIFPNSTAPTSTALYPATVACELSTSML
jgi:hypothetical protein